MCARITMKMIMKSRPIGLVLELWGKGVLICKQLEAGCEIYVEAERR